MKPPSIVIDHFLSTKWSKKLFTINHYELQNGKCIVTQELSAYEIIAHALNEMKREMGEKFNPDKVNLAELERTQDRNLTGQTAKNKKIRLY